MRLLAWTPTWDNELAPETVASMDAQRFDGTLDWVVSRNNPWPAPDHRNVLAQYRVARARCLDDGYDALLTVEHDMILPHNAAQLLANTPGDVVYGVYVFRCGAYVLNVFEYTGSAKMGVSLSADPRMARAALQKGVVRVSGCGWGCTLLRRSTLEMIDFPEEYPENPAFDVRLAQIANRAGLLLNANFQVLCGHKKRVMDVRNTRRMDIYHDEILWPFQDDETVDLLERTGTDIMVDGDAVTIFKPRRRKPNVGALAKETVNVRIDGGTKRLVAGQGYVLSYHSAMELARAGHVEIL